MKLNNFDIATEFNCKCGCGKGAREMYPDFLKRLDASRDDVGVAFVINSAYRCDRHNLSVGGKPTSAHLKGLAVDIACIGDYNRYLIINALQLHGFTRFGIAPDFIHVDDDPTKNPERIWVYK